ncbi:NAD-dependent protein deacetylase hst4 [Cladobotryum mycophilum]|uniref:NAD-dependent protein deacetylase hst4 n=1 Tax=Cladobotryum mycophilum TaxID=491253 RepID=A0ABR0SF49_9HYPO
MDPSSPLSSPRGYLLRDLEFSNSSSPLSSLHSSPSIPESLDPARRYPSPMSTIASGTQSPSKSATKIILGQPMDDNDSQMSPKERRTEYLDLTKSDAELTSNDHCQMERLATLLRKKKKIVVIAGAGISVSAGIPDFRSATGLFARAKNQHNLKGSGKQLFDASVYKHDSSTESFHTMVREMAEMSKKAQPTPFHHLLASLSQEKRLLRLYSQNIDCLDTNMKPLETKVPLPSKGPWPTTVQLHGGLQKMVCSKCGQLEPFNSQLFDGPEAPLCETCKVDDEVRTAHAGKRSHGIGRLRPRFVLYNEFNPDGEAIGNVSTADLKARPDAVIVVGTTLKVPGTRRLTKELCQVTRGRRDGLTVWINLDPEPKGAELKDCWDIVVRAKCDDVARLAALPPWDCDIGSDYLVSKNHVHAGNGKTNIEIALATSPNKGEFELGVQAIPTPRPSPKPTSKTAPKKQTKISFASKAEKDKPAPKATSTRARKPKQPAKSKAAPKNAGIQNFATVKKNVPAAGKTKAIHVIPDIPSRKRSREETVSVPPSPTLRARKFPETISPKAVPRALRRFID